MRFQVLSKTLRVTTRRPDHASESQIASRNRWWRGP